LTFGAVKRKIEACIDSDGRYTLRLWTTGSEPLLPKVFLQGRNRALYSAARVEELLQAYRKSDRI
jgi:hypothetical protein